MTGARTLVPVGDQEFRVGLKLRVFNFNLKRALDATGKRRQDIARDLGMSVGTLHSYTNLKRFPPERVRMRIAIYLNVTLDTIFPEHLETVELRHQPPAIGLTREEAEYAGLTSQDTRPPDEVAEESEVKGLIEAALDTLPDNQRMVLIHHYGLCGEVALELSEIATLLGVSRTRVWQLKMNALRFMRHPKRSRRIRDALTGEDTRNWPIMLMSGWR